MWHALPWLADCLINGLCYDQQYDTSRNVEEFWWMVGLVSRTYRGAVSLIPWIVGYCMSSAYYYIVFRFLLVRFGFIGGMFIFAAITFAFSLPFIVLYEQLELDLFSIHKIKGGTKWVHRWIRPSFRKWAISPFLFLMNVIFQSPVVNFFCFRKEARKELGLTEIGILAGSIVAATLYWGVVHKWILNRGYGMAGFPMI